MVIGNPPLKQPHTSALRASAPRHPHTRRIVTAGDSETGQNQASYKKNRLPYRSFFILGNTPILSSAEIFAVFVRKKIVVEWEVVSDEVIILATKGPFVAITTLGGTVKMGVLLPDDITPEQWVRNRKSDRRLVVGVSVYKAADGVANARCAAVLQRVQGEILSAKRVFKEEGQALRLVTARDRMLPSVSLVTERILERGGELVAFVSHKGVQFGETLAVQAFHEYRRRDMGRPGRNARRGMLPPKVAQMMVNLASVKEGGLVFDPFCGSGTVLQEAALLGYQTVGSDISKEAVHDAQKNFQFLISNLQKNPKSKIPNHRLFISDARYIMHHVQKQSVDAIVTEPYLGPPFTGREKPAQLAKIRQYVSALVMDAFKSFRDVLRPGGRVVIVLPVYLRLDLRGEVQPHALFPIDGIEKLGWRLVTDYIPRSSSKGYHNGFTSRNTILYRRADQHLAREITVWTRA